MRPPRVSNSDGGVRREFGSEGVLGEEGEREREKDDRKGTETKGGGGAASRSAPCSSATTGSRRSSRDSTSASPLAPAASSSAQMDQARLHS